MDSKMVFDSIRDALFFEEEIIIESSWLSELKYVRETSCEFELHFIFIYDIISEDLAIIFS